MKLNTEDNSKYTVNDTNCLFHAAGPEELPPGGFRGDEELPAGGFRA